MTPEQLSDFERDRFLILPSFLDSDVVERLRSRFGSMFRGAFDTGPYPDEWNWRDGRIA